MKKILCFTIVAFTSTLWAKNFSNSYLSFELPNTWNCKLENTEWVCRSDSEKEAKEAIIIITAKEVGPTDTHQAYMTHLNTPQATSVKGAGGVSKIAYPPKSVMINDHTWIDGLHMASEVPNYYTRYLATIKGKIAVLFTCSAHKDVYAKYASDFLRAVQSLRVTATDDLFKKGPDIRGTGDSPFGAIGQHTGGLDMNAGGGMGDGADGSGGGGTSAKKIFLLLAIILAAVGGYIYIKSRKS